MINLFNVIGIGQCGCRIAKEFNKIGFNTCYINSDSVDMRDFIVPKDKLLMLGTSGSGRSPVKGAAILKSNFTIFSDFMDIHLQRDALNLFVIGMGGGTGGGMIIPVLEYAQEKDIKVGVLATLPPKLSGMLDMDNAMRVLKKLRTVDMNMFILADNEYLIEKVGLSTEWWQRINYYILTKVIAAFDILRDNKTSQKGIGSIDMGELSRILQYGKGLLDIRDIYFTLPDELSISDEELKEKLFEPSLINGYNYKDTLFYLISIDVPDKGGYTEFASRVFKITKGSFGSALARIGMFIDPILSKSIRVTIITAGLKLPKVLRSKINNLKRDSIRHEIKKNKLDSVDFTDMDEISINDDFDL